MKENEQAARKKVKEKKIHANLTTAQPESNGSLHTRSNSPNEQ
jgi:hypothetical protein